MNTTTSLPPADADLTYDVIVLGSGAAGFAAAVTASCRGLKVLLVEKTEAFGGTSAISGGAVWLHDTDQALAMLEGVLPIRVEQTFPGWTTVKPR